MTAYFEYHNPPPSRDTQADLDRIPDHFARLTTTMRKDRETKQPGGCECEDCGCIFIGGPEHSMCGGCFAAYKEAEDWCDQP